MRPVWALVEAGSRLRSVAGGTPMAVHHEGTKGTKDSDGTPCSSHSAPEEFVK